MIDLAPENSSSVIDLREIRRVLGNVGQSFVLGVVEGVCECLVARRVNNQVLLFRITRLTPLYSAPTRVVAWGLSHIVLIPINKSVTEMKGNQISLDE